MTIAATCFKNPRFYKGPIPEQTLMRAKDSQTWNAGQFVRRSASGIVLCASNATKIAGLTAETQRTATSSSDVPIYIIPDANTQLVILASTKNSNDTTAAIANIGKNRGLNVNTSICTMSMSSDTAGTAAFAIKDIYANKDKFKTDTDTTPGEYIVTVRQAFLDG